MSAQVNPSLQLVVQLPHPVETHDDAPQLSPVQELPQLSVHDALQVPSGVHPEAQLSPVQGSPQLSVHSALHEPSGVHPEPASSPPEASTKPPPASSPPPTWPPAS